jgi:hypothetical protein
MILGIDIDARGAIALLTPTGELDMPCRADGPIVLPVKLAIQIARAAEGAKNPRPSASPDDRDIGPGAEALGF